MKDYKIGSDDIFGGITVKGPEKCCLCCEHCTDIFWDYSNGPYMLICNVDGPTTKGICDKFKEEINEDN